MLKHNIPAEVASERLGHSTIEITLDLYRHVMKEMQEELHKNLIMLYSKISNCLTLVSKKWRKKNIYVVYKPREGFNMAKVKSSVNFDEAKLTPVQRKIVKALEEPMYNWRTIKGISNEIKLPADEILKELNELKKTGYILQTSRKRPNFQYLYTTRSNYNRKIGRRILSALTDRIK